LGSETTTTRGRRPALAVLALLGVTLTGCQAAPSHPSMPSGHGGAASHAEAPAAKPGAGKEAVLDLRGAPDIPGIVEQLAGYDAVFVGESHTRYDHHRNQLAVIRGLYERNPDLAIGAEFFQRRFQPALDDYIAGRLDEAGMLEKTGYFDRWRYDYRLYRPILRFARDKGIPVIALNLANRKVRAVARHGRDGLDAAQREGLPAIRVEPDAAYRARLRKTFERHPQQGGRTFENFVQAQLLWDEGMAERVAGHLADHPGRRMVVLAGNGHVVYGQGIPERVEARGDYDTAVVVNGVESSYGPGVADFLVLSEEETLPKPGRLGVFLGQEDGAVIADGFDEGSPARKAGMEEGDRFVAIAGRPIESMADIRIAMLGRAPGEKVTVRVERDPLFGGPTEHEYEVELH